MSYHHVRNSISYIIGFISSLIIVFINFNEPDPLIFGISAFAGFIGFTLLAWFLTGLLIMNLPTDEPETEETPTEVEEKEGTLLDVTVGDDPVAQVPAGQADEQDSELKSPLLDALGKDGKVDWDKLSPHEQDIDNEFIPLDLFSKK